jgi:putative ATPase
MELFEGNLAQHQPLARRCAPQSFSEFIGQEQIVGPGRLLRRAIEADRLSSLIFSGPPGTGKTALANLIAKYSKATFVQLNAVNSKVADLREVVEQAKERLAYNNQRTILFVDEIHRFNKAQQDALLPDVESGIVILIGATTENPYFSVNPALISRSQVFEFKALEREDLSKIIDQAIKKIQPPIILEEAARQHLLAMSGGDARKVLSALELAIMTTPPHDGQITITLPIAEESIQKKKLVYDESEHYDIISAFIKSMRGSDPDAVLYWLAKMIYAGEDPRFIARRIVICASEDVGNADPLALVVANACLTTVAEIGYPEARITLAQAAVYVATAPKSNASYIGIDKALADIGNGVDLPVPTHLKNKASGYRYAHDFPKAHDKDQTYLPDKKAYYLPTDRGYEKKISEWLKWLKL